MLLLFTPGVGVNNVANWESSNTVKVFDSCTAFGFTFSQLWFCVEHFWVCVVQVVLCSEESEDAVVHARCFVGRGNYSNREALNTVKIYDTWAPFDVSPQSLLLKLFCLNYFFKSFQYFYFKSEFISNVYLFVKFGHGQGHQGSFCPTNRSQFWQTLRISAVVLCRASSLAYSIRHLRARRRFIICFTWFVILITKSSHKYSHEMKSIFLFQESLFRQCCL